MNKIYVKEILELAQGSPIRIDIDDEIFGILTYEYFSYNYKLLENEIEITDSKDFLNTRTLEYKLIREIVVNANQDIIKQAIEKAQSMTSIVAFIHEKIDYDKEIQELFELKQKEIFNLHLSRYIRLLKVEIQEKINSMGYNLSVDSVFNEMVVNITKKNKIENKQDFECFRQGVRNADDLIEKIIKSKEKEIF